MALDSSKIKNDFPIFSRTIKGRPLVYLDNTATTQKPRQVLSAMTGFYEHSNANVHRGGYTLGFEASEAFDKARKTVAAFIGAEPEEIVFTKNATESLNLAAYSLFRSKLEPGDGIVSTLMEHHSNFVPWQQLAKDTRCTFGVTKITPDGFLDLEHFKSMLASKPKIAAFTHASNILGTITPVEELCRLVKKAGAISVVDGAQAVPHMPVDVKKIDCDFYAFSGHKMLGPTGVGVLYARREILEDLKPFLYGGDMIMEVTTEETIFNSVPRKFEAGTPNIAEAIGLEAACKYLSTIGLSKIREHEKALTAYALERLKGVNGISIYGPTDTEHKGGVVSFNIKGLHPHDGAAVLDSYGIAVRSGDHCGQPLMRELGIIGTLRASFYIYNTKEDIDAMIEGLHRARELFC